MPRLETENVKIIQEELQLIESISANNAITMPPSFYTDPDFLEVEKKILFRTDWVCLGRVDEIPNIGDYITADIVGEQLLIVRDNDNEIRVMSNVCRHRSSMIASGRGNKKRFTCPYHAWSYDNDGQLLSAPYMDRVEGFDKKSCKLPSFNTEIWQGFIFVNLDGKAKALSPQLEGLLPHIKNYHLESMNHIHAEETIWGANWKCLGENFMEGYHLSPTHAKTLHPITPTALCKKIPGEDAYTAYKSHYPPSLPERTPYHSDLTDEEKRYGVLFWIYPSLVAVVSSHFSVYIILRPDTADTVDLRWGVVGHSEPGDQAALDYLELVNAFNAEDRQKLEGVQKGLKSRAAVRSYLAPPDFEGTIWDFYQYVSSRIGRISDSIVESKCDTEVDL